MNSGKKRSSSIPKDASINMMIPVIENLNTKLTSAINNKITANNTHDITRLLSNLNSFGNPALGKKPIINKADEDKIVEFYKNCRKEGFLNQPESGAINAKIIKNISSSSVEEAKERDLDGTLMRIVRYKPRPEKLPESDYESESESESESELTSESNSDSSSEREIKEPVTQTKKRRAENTSTSTINTHHFISNKRQTFSTNDLVTATDQGDAKEVARIVSGNEEWHTKPIPNNADGDTYLMYALRKQQNTENIIAALLPPVTVSKKSMQQLFVSSNSNHAGDTLMSIAIESDTVLALINGIGIAARNANVRDPDIYTNFVRSIFTKIACPPQYRPKQN